MTDLERYDDLGAAPRGVPYSETGVPAPPPVPGGPAPQPTPTPPQPTPTPGGA